ncbi:thioesterase family protein [Prevotella sp. PINT]|jgi:Predicted thioesterase|uniref:thioesterase family protein n=1 Tax=Palleniella intestinalis TaxID=2736291 RepID=UPI001552052B|nr:thioesterase family protein [Palleniella intestinalis]NPD81151.1 thioesterase family protein [Palleniella intestinalis]
MIKEGLTYTSCLTVKESDTAIALGSGDMPVLATPRMMALMENAAMLAVAGSLQEGETTVGGHIESSHLCPTPVGKTVEATARLVTVDGRKLTFEIEAYCDGTLLGKGSHLRFIVNREKFLGKL